MQTQGKQKTIVNTYTLLSTDDAQISVVVRDVPCSKIKEALAKNRSARCTYHAMQIWLDDKNEKHVKCWSIKLNDKGALEYSTLYSFTAKDISLALFANMDLKAVGETGKQTK